MSQGRKSLRSRRVARWRRDQFDVVAERPQLADHLARPHLLRLHTDRWATFFVPNALVQNLPDQTTESVSDRANRLGVAEARDEATIHDREDAALRLPSVDTQNRPLI